MKSENIFIKNVSRPFKIILDPTHAFQTLKLVDGEWWNPLKPNQNTDPILTR